MCTAMTLQTLQGDTYFGRTMDFSYPLAPELYIIPNGYKWNNVLNTHKFQNQYSFMGIGQEISPLIFADGVNEMGFVAAALYFPDYAHFDTQIPEDNSILSVAAIEMVNFLLSQCANVEHAVSILQILRIIGVKDSVTNSVAPLHWMISDKNGRCMVIEKTEDGLHLINNPIGVLSNSPDFNWHMTNLRNYMNVTPYQNQDKEWDSVNLTPFGQGGGTFGMPGDYTPPARFVRTSFQKSHTILPSNKEEAVITCFHIMESVSIPKGVVMTSRGTADYTQYTAFINLSTMEYYFKSYDNSQIISAKLPAKYECGTKILHLGKLTRPITFEQRNQ